MTKRDYLIIFCLLLPFFITLPWAITTHGKLQEQRELTELVRDTLHIVRLRHSRLLEATEGGSSPNLHLEDNTVSSSAIAPEETPEAPISSAAAIEAEDIEPKEPMSLVETPTIENAAAPTTTSPPAEKPQLVSLAPALQQAQKGPATPSLKPESNTLEANATPARQRASDPPAEPKPTKVTAPLTLRLVPDAVRTAPVNTRLQEQLGLKSEAEIRTSNLKVQVLQEVRGDASSSPNNQRRLQVDFALSEVPEAYLGQKSSLYLVVTDRSGASLPGVKPVSASVPVNGANVELTAMTKRDITLKANQNLRLEQKIANGLAPGNYRVQVFSDMALLGVTELIVLSSLEDR